MKPLVFLALCALALAGCASVFDPPDVTVQTGEAYCISQDPRVCQQLFAIGATLHTQQMNDAISAAKPGVPR